jgi:hypothetical protein
VALVPSIGDESETIPWTVLRVTAHTVTPSVFFDSAPDSGYSTDDIAPAVPGSLQLAGADLAWDPSPDADFQYFTVYGSETGDPGNAVLLGYTIDPAFDVSAAAHAFYLVSATDDAGNESVAASVENPAVDAPAPHASFAFSLQAPRPNPSAGDATISFTLPAAARVVLDVIDVRGARVVTLIDTRADAGRHSKVWDGRDASGRSAAPGVYFLRLRADDSRLVRKLLRVR